LPGYIRDYLPAISGVYMAISKIQKVLRALNARCVDCDTDIYRDEDGVMKVLYCPLCGDKLLQPSLCKICGNPVNADAVYCTGCGVEIVR
jgi:predicted RNA-binding Zn-ribbon protein involved in translation (DUF1610 family)